MGSLFVVFGVAGLIAWRWGRRVWPMLTKAFSWGDDLGGLTMFYKFGGARAVGHGITKGARVLLWAVALILAMFDTRARIAVVIYAAWKLRHRFQQAAAQRAELARAGMTRDERDVLHEAMTTTLAAMGLTSKGGEPIPPHCYQWAKRPVTAGGKALPGKWRYSCKIEPAPGRSMAELNDYVGRGIDADNDRLRDSLNASLRAIQGRQVKALRKAGLLPGPFVLTTLEHVTRDGQKIGRGRLSLWTTDPFLRTVDYPHDPTRPVVRRFTDPVPVGLSRSNIEVKLQLDLHTSVQGSNGAGKSSLLRPAIIAAAHTKAVIIVLALKGPNDYIELADRFAGGTVISDHRQAARVLRWAKVEIDYRNHMTPPELAKQPHILIILDEGQELKGDIGLIVPLVKLGRSAKVWTWSATQYAPSSVKLENGGFPTTLGRELGQRMAGRIEGTHSHAQVAVGSRVSKTAGPQMIPPGKKWRGVLFGDDGRYLRVYWVSCESASGKPSDMARCAAALAPRPADPLGFAEALAAPSVPFELPDLVAVSWPQDGAERAADGSATALTVESTSLPVRQALVAAWSNAGKQNPPSGRLTRTITVRTTAAARTRSEHRADQKGEAADPVLVEQFDLIDRFLAAPLDDDATVAA